MQIAALCVSHNSEYHKLGLDCYDIHKDTRTYIGTNPVIAHPPCRGYSAYMSHFSKPPPGEKDLALFCTEQIARYGGVLEHPAHSRFLKDYGFMDSKSWKITTVHQSWFGYPTTKRTWLLTPATYVIPQPPFTLSSYGREKEIFESMSHRMRSHTTREFAEYLISIIRRNT